jgi:hypothetical protein
MRRIVAMALLVVIASSVAVASNDRLLDHYTKALAAHSKGQWREAAYELEQAIAIQREEQLSLPQRRGSVVYIPHFWMGMARLELGQPAEALRSFELSLRQGVIQRTTEFAELRRAMGRAEAEMSSAAEALQQAMRAADAAHGKVLTAQMEAVVAGASRRTAFRTAELKMKEAAALRARNDLNSLRDATRLNSEAVTLFETAREEELKANAAVRAQQTTRPVEQRPVSLASPESAGPLPATDRSATPPAAEPPQITAQRQAGSVQPDHSRPSGRSETVLRPPVPGPAGQQRSSRIDPRIEEAYLSYARGRFEDAEALLSDAIAQTNSAEARLVRACVRYTRALLADDERLFEAADADLRAAFGAEPALRLNPAAFPPKVLRFVTTRGAQR